jgi:hypothetical protein
MLLTLTVDLSMTNLTVKRTETSGYNYYTRGYNKIFRNQWRTNRYALPDLWVAQIDKVVTGNWGWHFIPHKNIDYQRPNWYEDQTLVITFENQHDLVQVKLCIKN